ncbi:hypothetical protein B0H14DRAFT_2644024 [Mycena olivaceomarginata]|nr:hypothetical protein B0H14DRAFT_2644024 [Mycena olivaceomarginata]
MSQLPVRPLTSIASAFARGGTTGRRLQRILRVGSGGGAAESSTNALNRSQASAEVVKLTVIESLKLIAMSMGRSRSGQVPLPALPASHIGVEAKRHACFANGSGSTGRTRLESWACGSREIRHSFVPQSTINSRQPTLYLQQPNIGHGPLVCGGEIWYSEDGYVEGIRVKAGKRQSFPMTTAAEALSVLGHRRLGLDQQPQDLVDDHAGCEDWTESYAVADVRAFREVWVRGISANGAIP